MCNYLFHIDNQLMNSNFVKVLSPFEIFINIKILLNLDIILLELDLERN